MRPNGTFRILLQNALWRFSNCWQFENENGTGGNINTLPIRCCRTHCAEESRSGPIGRADIFFVILSNNYLTEIIVIARGIAGQNPIQAIFAANVIEKEVSVSGLVCSATTDTGSSPVAVAFVGRDHIWTSIFFTSSFQT